MLVDEVPVELDGPLVLGVELADLLILDNEMVANFDHTGEVLLLGVHILQVLRF